ncbi:MAG: SPOR domain-containing protein [Bacteroidota bacterium]
MGRSTRTIGFYCTLLIPVLWLTGCGASTGSSSSEADYIEEARRYEKGFRPSDFDPDPVAAVSTQVSNQPVSEAPHLPKTSVPLEFVSGFRVQIFSSNNIDDANAMKAEVEQRFTDQWFYVVYDPPTYKLRGGDFLTRYEADRFAKFLKDAGHKDAWIVPERVYKNLPPRSVVPVDQPPKE